MVAAEAIQDFGLSLLLDRIPITVNMAKLAGTPTVRLRSASPWTTMSLMNMPIAAPIPPTAGPNTAAKTAGITTAMPQNLTTPTIGANIPK